MSAMIRVRRCRLVIAALFIVVTAPGAGAQAANPLAGLDAYISRATAFMARRA